MWRLFKWEKRHWRKKNNYLCFWGRKRGQGGVTQREALLTNFQGKKKKTKQAPVCVCKISKWQLCIKCWIRCDRNWKYCLHPQVPQQWKTKLLTVNVRIYTCQTHHALKTRALISKNKESNTDQYLETLLILPTVLSKSYLDYTASLKPNSRYFSLKIGKVQIYQKKKRKKTGKQGGKTNSSFHKHKVTQRAQVLHSFFASSSSNWKAVRFLCHFQQKMGHIFNSRMILASHD